MITFVSSAARRRLLALFAASACASGSHAASLDLSDCAIVNGKKSAAAYKKWTGENQRAADAGEHYAIRNRAAVANNRLVCIEEEATGDAGWTVTMTPAGKGADAVTETTGPTGISDIAKKPAELKVLKEALQLTHAAGAFDPGYKSMSAQIAARYASALPAYVETAYADAAGAYAFDCILKRTYGKRLPENACPMIRPARAQLLAKVAPARRAEIDAEAQAWAKSLSVKDAD